MSKAVSRGASFLPRVGKYSMHAHRNGRVAVLPPGAKMETFGALDERRRRLRDDLQEAIDEHQKLKRTLRAGHPNFETMWKKYFRPFTERDRLSVPSSLARRFDELKRSGERVQVLQSQVEAFRFAFGEAMTKSYEQAWVQTAKAMLPDDVIDKIDAAVDANLHSTKVDVSN